MPYFKKEKYFEQSVNSVLSQSYKNFEVIIIDDELSLQSKNLLSKISQIDARIKIISNPTNLGAGLSRNNGIKFSNGEFIAFCDCDDLWKKNKLEEQIKFMNTSNLEFSFTSYEIINNKNEKIGLRKAEKNLSFKKLRNSCDIGLSTVIIKKNIFDNEKFRFGKTKTKEDFILWLMLAKNGISINGIDECLTSWRKNSKSLSSSSIQKIIDGYKVYRNYLHYGRIKSFFFLIILSLNFMLKNIR
jgi:teichuronic acid biosynthesis glycosyltransferase TuaG